MARATEIYLEKLALSQVKQAEPLLQEHIVDADFEDEDQFLDSSGPACWAAVGSNQTSYFHPVESVPVTIITRQSAEEPRVEALVVERYIVYTYSAEEYIGRKKLRLDAWDLQAMAWKSSKPVKIVGGDGYSLGDLKKSERAFAVVLKIKGPPTGEAGTVRKLDMTMEDFFSAFGSRARVSAKDLFAWRRRKIHTQPTKFQLRSGLKVKVEDDRVFVSHRDLDIVFSAPFVHSDTDTETRSVLDTNFAISYNRPFIYNGPPSILTDGVNFRRSLSPREPTYFIHDMDDSGIYLYSKANLFRYGETLAKIELDDFGDDLDADGYPEQIRKFANLLYLIQAPTEVRVYDLFNLHKAHTNRPLISAES
jgi:hypothetical protein